MSSFALTPGKRVLYLIKDPERIRAQLAGTLTLHMKDVWDQGYKGKGIGIAIVDTGIAPHPDLAPRIVAFHDVVNGQAGPYDDHGHGLDGHPAGSADRIPGDPDGGFVQAAISRAEFYPKRIERPRRHGHAFRAGYFELHQLYFLLLHIEIAERGAETRSQRKASDDKTGACPIGK